MTARWLLGERKLLDEFISKNRDQIAIDYDGAEVFLPRIQWDIDKVKADFPKIELKTVKDFIL